MITHPAFRLQGEVKGLFRTGSTRHFETVPVDHLDLTFQGIEGDRHGGLTRKSGGREPWYARGTPMRNERQLSLLSPDDMAAIASGLGIEQVMPEWIGGNLLIAGIADFTLLPPRTCLFFGGGVTIRIDGLNVPCRASGRAIAMHHPDRSNLDTDFVKVARHLRGLVGWVEIPGNIRMGEAVEVRVPEQRLYEISRPTI
jgi:hypothetical protein